MSKADIWDFLQRIEQENVFREKILMPLFTEMHLNPNHTHGSGERGKDIICFETNDFGFQECVAVVAKVGKISAKASGPTSFSEVMNQVQDAFRFPYKDPKTKKEISVNKVLVITNSEIMLTAKSKIVNGLGKPGPQNANVHFIDGECLAGLIEESWPSFIKDSSYILETIDWMSKEASLILYVLSRPYIKRKERRKRKIDLSITTIIKQTDFSRTTVTSALDYMLRENYIEKTSRGTYKLHSKETVGTLLIDEDQIQLFFQVEKLAAKKDYRFQKSDVFKLGDKLNFSKSFVKSTFSFLERGRYVKRDESRGGDCYKFDIETLDEEREYLKYRLQYHDRIPSRVK